jgi:hypothetical protein
MSVDDQDPGTDQPADDQDGGQEPTPEQIDSDLLDEIQEVAPPGLWNRIESGDVANPEQAVADRAWDRIKAIDPDLAARAEERAALVAAEREEKEREEAERLAQLDAASELNALSDEERKARIAQDLEEDVTMQRLALRKAFVDLRNTPFPDHDAAAQAMLDQVAPAEQLAEILDSTKTSGAEKTQAWDEAKPEVREFARQWFGLQGPADVDITTDEYRAGIAEEEGLVDWKHAHGAPLITDRDLAELRAKASDIIRGRLLATDQLTDHVEYLLENVNALPYGADDLPTAIQEQPRVVRDWLNFVAELRHVVSVIDAHHQLAEEEATPEIRNLTGGVGGA